MVWAKNSIANKKSFPFGAISFNEVEGRKRARISVGKQKSEIRLFFFPAGDNRFENNRNVPPPPFGRSTVAGKI